MGIERMHPPKYWKNRAEEFRAKADNAEHHETKATLRKAAESYEELARRAEKIRTVQDLEE
jgi:predicted phage-related endonuclease